MVDAADAGVGFVRVEGVGCGVVVRQGDVEVGCFFGEGRGWVLVFFGMGCDAMVLG